MYLSRMRPRIWRFAQELSKAFQANHLEAFVTGDLSTGARLGDSLWEALAESRALIVVVPTSGPTPNMGIEIGAAAAWNKPTFGIISDPSVSNLPLTVPEMPLYTLGRIDEVIQKVKESGQQLSDADLQSLSRLYAEMGESVDRFALEPALLSDLTRHFRKDTGKTVPGERLLSELLRLRKQGHLPKMLKPGQAAPASGQYQVIGPRGHRGKEVTVAKGQTLPPIPNSGHYKLVMSRGTTEAAR